MHLPSRASDTAQEVLKPPVPFLLSISDGVQFEQTFGENLFPQLLLDFGGFPLSGWTNLRVNYHQEQYQWFYSHQ